MEVEQVKTEKSKDNIGTYYQMNTYNDRIIQTLSFKPELYQKIQEEEEGISKDNIFKTSWFKRNKEIRFIAQIHENVIDIDSIDGKARINLINEEIIKEELNNLPRKEREKYRNIYLGGIQFTIKGYFQQNIDTPLQIFIVDDRIRGNMLNALVSVIQTNLIYQKTKFTIKPNFSVSLQDINKEAALVLYFKLQGIEMTPNSKVMSIETKILYALTGNHHIKKKDNKSLLIPKIYNEIIEQVEHRESSNITIPEEIYIDFSNRSLPDHRKMITQIDGPRISFRKSKVEGKLRTINLIEKPKDVQKTIRIIVKIIGIGECVAEINTEATKSFIHISKVNQKECKGIDAQIYNHPNMSRNIIVTKKVKLELMIQTLKFKIKIGVLEQDNFCELLLGQDFLRNFKYSIDNGGILIIDPMQTIYVKKL